MQLKTIIAAGGLVFNEKNELLMIYRRGKWDLPKGKLDEGERIEDCAVREVMEETGINRINISNKIGETYHAYFEDEVILLKETPLIQVIDKPILPLKKEKLGKLKSLILGGFLAGFLTVLVLIFKKLFAGILAD